MEKGESIAIIISVLAIIISIWDRIANNKANSKANQKAEKAIKISQGTIELEIRNSISSARNRITDFWFEFKKLKNDNPHGDFSSYQKISSAILEDYFNHYDRACRLYLERKIDRKSFKKEYKMELVKIVENPNYSEYFDPKKGRFKAILKVYKKWQTKSILKSQ